jgi:hypothetical protein
MAISERDRELLRKTILELEARADRLRVQYLDTVKTIPIGKSETEEYKQVNRKLDGIAAERRRVLREADEARRKLTVPESKIKKPPAAPKAKTHRSGTHEQPKG